MLHIIKFKGCKRCGGDLFLERDSEEIYISCLQCGAVYMRRDKEERKNIEEVPAGSGTGRHHH